MYSSILGIIYLIGSVTFIMGLKMMSNPKTARNGNLLGACGMTIAIVGTIVLFEKKDGMGNIIPDFHVSPIIYILIFSAVIIGTIIGWMTAKKVLMTKMPELVSIFNGMGGACAALISLIEFNHHISPGEKAETGFMLAIVAGLIIGSISFSGSMVAFLKLNGTMAKPVRLPSYNMLNNVIVLGVLALGAYIIYTSGETQNLASLQIYMYLLFAAALFYGIMFTIPIGGADMPVVISLLNSFTGMAAAFGGFLYDNKIMLTGGILVGSAGTILTLVMCKAMNRSLTSVIFGAFGEGSGKTTTSVVGAAGASVREASVTDVAVMMNYSKKVVIVPGYGLAVAQAQHVIHELEMLLEERGVEVKYAIHPVAGRMPGHMNVLLAEANVDYAKLVEMDDINSEFEQTDVVLIVGANDVVNPAAKNNPASPIYGMPILEVYKSKNIIINKRSMNAGYAGIDNELFYNPKASMFFGDAKKAITQLVAELKTM